MTNPAIPASVCKFGRFRIVLAFLLRLFLAVHPIPDPKHLSTQLLGVLGAFPVAFSSPSCAQCHLPFFGLQ